MKNILSLYYKDHPRTAERFNALVEDMEEAIRANMTDEQKEYVDQHTKTKHLLTLDMLEGALGKGAEHISGMRRGRMPISRGTMLTLHYLKTLVVGHPEAAIRAIEDHMDRAEEKD